MLMLTDHGYDPRMMALSGGWGSRLALAFLSRLKCQSIPSWCPGVTVCSRTTAFLTPPFCLEQSNPLHIGDQSGPHYTSQSTGSGARAPIECSNNWLESRLAGHFESRRRHASCRLDKLVPDLLDKVPFHLVEGHFL